MRSVLCAITDRRRLAGTGAGALVVRIRAWAAAGVDLIQIRERDLEGRDLVDLVSAAVGAVRGTRTRVLVNERADVALAAGAHGVHLRSGSLPARQVRAFVPQGFLIGRSVHGADEARRVERDGGLDYLLFGTVFESGSKPGRRPAGLSALGDVARAGRLPVLAVGGVSVERARGIGASGAAGMAAIGLFSDGTESGIDEIARDLRHAFDTP